MESIKISSTDLKRKTAEVLNLVAYGKATALVERFGEPLVKIIPVVEKSSSVNFKKNLKKYFGSIPKFPKANKTRYFRKKSIAL